MKRSRRGFTLAETLVSLAILGITMGALYDLLRAGMQSVARTRSAEMTPQLDTAWLQVRDDVQSAGSVPSGGETWSDGPLDLRLPGGRTIRLGLRKGALVREERTGPVAHSPISRVLARPVRSFRWRCPGEGLVEVELTPATAFDGDTMGAVAPRASTVLCALRGAGRPAGAW